MGILIPGQGIFEQWTDNISSGPGTPYGSRGTNGGTAHTKNTTWDDVFFAGVSFDVYAISIAFSAVALSANNTACLVDIGIGAAGSEQVIISNLNAGFADTAANGLGQKYFFPIYIPANTRIACTGQSVTASSTYDIAMTCYGKPKYPVWSGRSVTTYGADTANSRGTTVAGAQSYSWGQIVASTTKAHRYLALGVSGNGNNTFPVGGWVLCGMAMGASGSELAIVQNKPIVVSTAEIIKASEPIGAYGDFPSGIRLAASFYKSFANAQSFDAIAYGVD